MKNKTECWFNVVMSVLLIALCYFMIYSSPNFEQIKIIVPILAATAGYMIHSNLTTLAKLEGYK